MAGKRASVDAEAEEECVAATEPGRDGREEVLISPAFAEVDDAATEPGRDGREEAVTGHAPGATGPGRNGARP